MPNEHWWNADFDLSLRKARHDLSDSGLETQVRELALHALTAAKAEDSVLLYDSPPEDFLRYLELKGIATPKISIFPKIRAGYRFSPYGWNAKALALNNSYDFLKKPPPLESVRLVNSRSFAHRIESESKHSMAPLGSFVTLVGLQLLIDSDTSWPHGWVAKTEHGNAALGNRRIRNRHLQENDIRWLGPRLEDGPMVLERWLNRTNDLCSVFEITRDGLVEGLAIHETIHTADGGFIGALYDREAEWPTEWRTTLIESAESTAKAVAGVGYFGPVCADAFAWNDNGTSRIRPLVDLNARRHASEGWRRLADLWAGCLYGRFFSTRKLRLPTTYDEFDDKLASDAWEIQTREGALLTSPLWLEGQGNRRRPRKLGVVFRGPSRKSVFAMETRFREIFER